MQLRHYPRQSDQLWTVHLGRLLYHANQRLLRSQDDMSEMCANIGYNFNLNRVYLVHHNKGIEEQGRAICHFTTDSTIIIHSHNQHGVDPFGYDYIYVAIPSPEDVSTLVKNRYEGNQVIQHSIVSTYLGCWIMSHDYSRTMDIYDSVAMDLYLHEMKRVMDPILLDPKLNIDGIYNIMNLYHEIATTLTLKIELYPTHYLAENDVSLPISRHIPLYI